MSRNGRPVDVTASAIYFLQVFESLSDQLSIKYFPLLHAKDAHQLFFCELRIPREIDFPNSILVAFFQVDINENSLAFPGLERNWKKGNASNISDINFRVFDKELDIPLLVVFGPNSQFQGSF